MGLLKAFCEAAKSLLTLIINHIDFPAVFQGRRIRQNLYFRLVNELNLLQ